MLKFIGPLVFAILVGHGTAQDIVVRRLPSCHAYPQVGVSSDEPLFVFSSARYVLTRGSREAVSIYQHLCPENVSIYFRRRLPRTVSQVSCLLQVIPVPCSGSFCSIFPQRPLTTFIVGTGVAETVCRAGFPWRASIYYSSTALLLMTTPCR